MPAPYYILSVLHPANILRGQFGKEPAQIHYLRHYRGLLVDLEAGREPSLIDVSEPPPGATLFPTRSDLEEWRLGPLAEGVTVDVEAAGPHLICVGLCRVADERSVCLRFRSQGGAVYWPTFDELCWAIEWLGEVLANPEIPLVFHNGSYDILEVLEAYGWKVVNYAFDTMLGQHVVFPEMPKALQFCATLHCRIPGWKWLVKEDEESGEGK